jgi:hypothetical protein
MHYLCLVQIEHSSPVVGERGHPWQGVTSGIAPVSSRHYGLGHCKPYPLQNYMKKHVSGQFILGELRQHVLLPLIGNPLFSEAEQLRANHFVHESEDIARLTRWGANVLVEIARRQAEAARQRRDLATGTTLRQLSSTSFRGHRSRPRRPAPTWVPSAFFPDRADRRAGTFDRANAARFQPADSLTFASLLNRPAR